MGLCSMLVARSSCMINGVFKNLPCSYQTQVGFLMQEEAPAGDDDAKGIEMEGDFEGSLHDIPANPEVDYVDY